MSAMRDFFAKMASANDPTKAIGAIVDVVNAGQQAMVQGAVNLAKDEGLISDETGKTIMNVQQVQQGMLQGAGELVGGALNVAANPVSATVGIITGAAVKGYEEGGGGVTGVLGAAVELSPGVFMNPIKGGVEAAVKAVQAGADGKYKEMGRQGTFVAANAAATVGVLAEGAVPVEGVEPVPGGEPAFEPIEEPPPSNEGPTTEPGEPPIHEPFEETPSFREGPTTEPGEPPIHEPFEETPSIREGPTTEPGEPPVHEPFEETPSFREDTIPESPPEFDPESNPESFPDVPSFPSIEEPGIPSESPSSFPEVPSFPEILEAPFEEPSPSTLESPPYEYEAPPVPEVEIVEAPPMVEVDPGSVDIPSESPGFVPESQEFVPDAIPSTEMPATEMPATEMPATEMPATEMPATEMPATEMPATEMPATEMAEEPPPQE